jgi:membrane-associated phospholipid phosphatase
MVARRDAGARAAGDEALDRAFPTSVPIQVPARVVDRVDNPGVATAHLMLIGYLVLAIGVTTLGLVLTAGLFGGALGSVDRALSRWITDQRTPLVSDISAVGSMLADTTTVLFVVGLSVLVLAIRRSWPRAGLLAIGLTLEVTAFLTATFIIVRDRPEIRQLDASPPTSSYPSGHTAAAVALYCGLAIVLSPSVRHTVLRIALWTAALLIPIAVAVSRMYRGMHHLTDVLAGALLGSLALILAILAVRAGAAVAERRRRSTPAPGAPAPRRAGVSELVR